MSKLAMQPSFRAVGQKAAEWHTFEKPMSTQVSYLHYCSETHLNY